LALFRISVRLPAQDCRFLSSRCAVLPENRGLWSMEVWTILCRTPFCRRNYCPDSSDCKPRKLLNSQTPQACDTCIELNFRKLQEFRSYRSYRSSDNTSNPCKLTQREPSALSSELLNSCARPRASGLGRSACRELLQLQEVERMRNLNIELPVFHPSSFINTLWCHCVSASCQSGRKGDAAHSLQIYG